MSPIKLKAVLESYDMEIHQKISMPDYQKLKTMVKRSIDQKLRLRNFDARNERIETGALVTNRGGQRGVERGQGECYQWKAEGQCSRGDQCSFRHEGHESAKPTPTTAPPSEPPTPRGRSVSRKRSLRGRGPSGKTNRQPCKNFLKGTCTTSPCGYWHPPDVTFVSPKQDVNSEQSADFRTGMLRNNPTKRPKKVDDRSAFAIVKSVRQLGCVLQDTEPPESLPILRKSTKVLGSIRRVRFTKATQRHANIRGNKGLSLGKFKSWFLISAVRTL